MSGAMGGLDLLINATDRMSGDEAGQGNGDASHVSGNKPLSEVVNRTIKDRKCAAAVFEAQDGQAAKDWNNGDRAARCGHLSLIQAKAEGGEELRWSERAMDEAAASGQLSVLKWLHAHGSQGCSRAALTNAAAGGHLHVVEWCYANNIDGDISAAIAGAAENGHYNVVEWLRSHSANKRARTGDSSGHSAGPALAASSPAGNTGGSSVGSGSGGSRTVSPASAGAAAAAALAANPPMGMFGTPFGNYMPVNGVVLPRGTIPEHDSGGGPHPPGSAAAAMAAAQAAGSGAGVVRLRSNLLRTPELALAAMGGGHTQEERQLKAVIDFRKAYSSQALEGANIPKDPFTLFAVWFEEARIGRVSEPGAMCLATVGPTGRPSARYVMLQGFDKRGFVWYTNFESRKAQELAHNPYGALSFWWSELQRSVRIEGVVARVSEKESTEYFMSRPRGSQVGAWALHQSRPVASRAALERNVKEVQDKFSAQSEVPRPSHFGGYRLRPDRVEFWKGRQSRIHDRIVYVVVDDKWVMQRLQP